MGLQADIRYRDSLKARGHDLLDELERLGISKDRAYRRMARILQVPETEAHFGREIKVKKLERMVDILTSHRNDILRHKPKRGLIRPILGKKKDRKKLFPPAPAKPEPKIIIVKKLPDGPKIKTRGKADVLPRPAMIKALAELAEAQKHYKSVEPEGAARQKSPLKSMLESIGVV